MRVVASCMCRGPMKESRGNENLRRPENVLNVECAPLSTQILLGRMTAYVDLEYSSKISANY